MKFHSKILAVVLLTLTTGLGAQSLVNSLSCDYKVNPLGIDNPSPELSWKISNEKEGTMQDSYEIRAALDLSSLQRGRKLIWETGKVESSQSTFITYGGQPLKSFQRVYWQVRVTDNHGKRSAWSEPAWFEMGFLPGTAWQASWIAPSWKENPKKSMPSPYLRKDFSTKTGMASARLYITSHGLYEAEINGLKVGDQEFTPGWTSFDKRLQYQSYDVLDMLKSGENAIGIILGDGWYRGNLGWKDNRNIWGDRLAALAELHIRYADGTEEVIITDGSWKVTTAAILESDIYNGEIYDAGKQKEGWSQAGYDAGDWTSVVILEEDMDRLVAPEGPPVRIVEEIAPLSIEKRPEGWLVDMGQNMVGYLKISASGDKGDTIVVRHAEVLDKEGQMYYDNLRAAKATNTYILSGGKVESFAPHFTFQGFRYAMVQGYPGELSKDDIIGQVIHSDMTPAGNFSCSDSLVNQLQHNILWGLKGNFLDVPTDCPQRDERLGWTGDAQVFAPTACFNVDAAGFYRKWLKDLAADQAGDGRIPNVIPDILGGGGATGWADAGIVIPWVVYQHYGDVKVLENQYASMKAWISFMEEHAGEDLVWQEPDFHFGDWLSFASTRSDYMGAYTTKDLIATAYYRYSSSIVAKTAAILGKEDDRLYYEKLSSGIKKAFQKEYVTSTGRLVSHTQTAYTLALAFDMLDEDVIAKSAAHLGNDVKQFGHITTGFLGTPLISEVLTEHGMIDLAYMLLMRKEYPSWLYPVTMGATTIWERWDGQKPDSTFQNKGMNSFNHYAYGAIGNWMYTVVAGIGQDENNPGYKHFHIKPRPGGGLSHASASLESMYGTIVSSWKLEGEKLSMEVEIPANSSASIHIPGKAEDILFNGLPLPGTRLEYSYGDKEVILERGSGSCKIETSL